MKYYICEDCCTVLEENDFETKYDNYGLSYHDRLGCPGGAYEVCPRCGCDEHTLHKETKDGEAL